MSCLKGCATRSSHILDMGTQPKRFCDPSTLVKSFVEHREQLANKRKREFDDYTATDKLIAVLDEQMAVVDRVGKAELAFEAAYKKEIEVIALLEKARLLRLDAKEQCTRGCHELKGIFKFIDADNDEAIQNTAHGKFYSPDFVQSVICVPPGGNFIPCLADIAKFQCPCGQNLDSNARNHRGKVFYGCASYHSTNCFTKILENHMILLQKLA